MRTKNKALSLLFALVMVFSLLPVQAMAEEADAKAFVIVGVNDQDDSSYYTLSEAFTYAPEGGTVKLMTEEATANFTVPANNNVTLDLNGNTLTMSNTRTLTLQGGKRLTIKNGGLVSKAIRNDKDQIDGTVANFGIETNSSITLDGVTADTIGTLLYPRGDAATVNVYHSEIKCGVYAVSTNAGSAENYNVVINLEDSAFISTYGCADNDMDSCPVLVNVPCTLNMDGCTVTGSRQGVVVRGGDATIKDTTITLTGAYTGDPANKYTAGTNWASGNEVPMAGLVVGNQSQSSYQYPASCDLTNTTVTAPDGLPTAYVYAIDAETRTATLTYDAASDVGEVVLAGAAENITIPVKSVTLSESVLILTKDETAQLTATVSPDNAADKTVAWTSSDNSVATVDENGVVTAVREGVVRITATAGDANATCNVNVVYATGEYETEPNDAYVAPTDIVTPLRKKEADADKGVADVYIVYRKVSTLDELKAAESDESVAAIYIADDIQVSGTVTVAKPIEIGTGKKLTVEADGKLIATAGMQRLGFEDVSRVGPANYDRMAANGVFFLIGTNDAGIYRELLGSADAAAKALANGGVTWTAAVLAANTTISGDVSVSSVYCPDSVTLTLAPGARLFTKSELEPAAIEGWKVLVAQTDDGTYTYSVMPQTVQVIFDVTPEGAAVEVEGIDGNMIPPEEDGSYDLIIDRTYYYTVSAPGYVPKGGEFNTPSTVTADPQVVTVELVKQTTGGGSSGGGGSSSSSTTKTETVKNPDGSTTTTVTDAKTGTVTETVKTNDGVTGTTVTDKNGDVTKVTASVPADVARDAAKSGETVTLPVEVPAVKDADDAPAVAITVPKSSGAVKVEIPVEKVTSGTVAVIVKADGTEEIVKTSVTTEDGVALTVEGNTTVKVIDNSKRFADVHPVDHWATDSIDFVTSRELFNGKTSTTFAPNDSTTRAQLMTVLARLDGADTTGAALEKGMAWAVEKGISDGSNPGGTITRQQLAAMLYRYAGSPATDYELTHSDAHRVSDYAVDAMRWAVANGVITGKTDGTLDPHGLATRAQVAAMMARFCAKLG